MWNICGKLHCSKQFYENSAPPRPAERPKPALNRARAGLDIDTWIFPLLLLILSRGRGTILGYIPGVRRLFWSKSVGVRHTVKFAGRPGLQHPSSRISTVQDP